MSKTRNQRKRDSNFFEKVVCVLLVLFLLLMVRHTVRECRRTKYLQERGYESGAVVVPAKDFLPEDFDLEAYQDALRRYDEEHGLQGISAQKETAPELAGSRADDAII